MGYGLPAAIGAKLALPHKIVVDIDGDGSFLMTGMEMVRAVNDLSLAYSPPATPGHSLPFSASADIVHAHPALMALSPHALHCLCRSQQRSTA